MPTQVAASSDRQQLLLTALRQADRELSGQDLHALLRQGPQAMGLATVYRVLTQFEQAGILTRSHFESGKAVFELDEGQHHDHLVCLDCGRVEEFFDAQIESLQNDVAAAKGFYEEEGLNVTILPGGPDVAPTQVIAGGGADVVVDWMPSALAAREKGLALVNIAQPFKTSGLMLTCWKDSECAVIVSAFTVGITIAMSAFLAV